MANICNSAVNPESVAAFDFGRALLFETKDMQKRDRTRAAIYAAGYGLLNGASPSSLTVSEVCRRAGVAHGTFYIYFPNRQAFMASLLLRFVDFLQTVMQRRSQSDRADSVRAATAAYFDLFAQNTGMMRCLVNHLEEFPGARKAFQKLNRDWTATVVASAERRLARSKRAGKIPRDELVRRAYALGGMVDQYLMALLLNNDRSLIAVSGDREAVIGTLSHIWEKGLSQ